MFYLIIGENQPLIDDEIEIIRNDFLELPMETIKSEKSFDYFKENTTACDMFSPQKIQLLDDPKWLKKTAKNILDQLNQCLDIAKSFNCPIIIKLKKVDKRSATYKLMKKRGVIEKECHDFKEWENDKIVAWIQNYSKQKNATIRPDAAHMFLDSFGTNIGIIKQEIEKCLITIHPNTSISKEDVIHASSNAIGEYSKLSKSIKKGNIDQIIQSTHQLIQLKEDPHKIMNQLLFQLNQLLPLKLAIDEKISQEECAKIMGRHPYFIKKQMEEIHRNSLRTKLKSLFYEISQMDIKIKTGQLSSKIAIYQLMNQLKHQI